MNFQIVRLVLLVLVVLYVSSIEAGRGGGGGGGRGGGGGGGRGSSGGRTGSSGGKSSGKLSTGKKVGLVAGGALTSFVAYRSYKAAHSKYKDLDRESSDFDADDGDGTYKVQERTGYSRNEGSGMSALGLILFILGIVGVGATVWCCYNIGVPFWQDRRSKRNRTLSFSHIVSNNKGDDIPLRETPSTASPSPK